MIEVGRRKRHQPAPPHVVYAAFVTPNRHPARQWRRLAGDEQPPRVQEPSKPDLVMWSSLWPSRPDAVIRSDLPVDSEGQGTDLTWSLLVDEPEPEPPLMGHLRYTFGQ